jgi:CPA2 family monovalent cation:H+ antiporter-2
MAGDILIEIGIAFTAIAIAGTIASRAKFSVIPAYIIVGIIVGPNEPLSVAGLPLTLVDTREFIDVLAELGIVFLLFFLGLEFNLVQLRSNLGRIAGAGVVDFVINFGLGVALGVFFGYSVIETLFLAGIVYISSSAVITKSLIEQGWVANPESGPILGTLVFEDILIAIYLALLSAIVFQQGDFTGAISAIVSALVFLLVLTLIAWYGTAYIDRLFATTSDELFLLRILGITVLVAGLALSIGVSEAVAAFFVGTAFSQTSHVERIESVLAPTRDLFAAVFFFSIGLTTDVTLLVDVIGLLVAAVVLTTLGKLVSGTLSGRLSGLNVRRSLRVGFGVVPRGEFSLVIATLAASASTGVLQELIPAFAVGYVLIMSVVGTLLIQYADELIRLFDGFGRSGVGGR